MIKDDRSYHLRLQEFCDCFMETDFRKELERASKGVSGDPGGDPEELALKFLGLTLLYGANEEAKKISLQKSKEGKVLLSVEARGNYRLPAPSAQLAERVFSLARSMVHLDEDQGKVPFSLGLRNSSMEINMEFARGGGGESLTLTFKP
ncbi:MAG: hypothetical protein AMJ94_19780 [Deltaproteobacteria bacterium SM23_61]|nr:MAG: hypothetical protein AMJ94_19780 [Deltaproteobacteria bacterium SM23_61]